MNRFETRLAILFVITGIVVSAIGVFTYRGLTNIVNNITRETKPDLTLVMLKDISSSLSEAESSVRASTITGNDQYLDPYYSAIASIDRKMDSLQVLSRSAPTRKKMMIDSVASLVEQKFQVLRQMLELQDNNRVNTALNKISEKLERQKTNGDTAKSNIFKRLFNNKDKEGSVDTKQLQEDISQLSAEETKIEQRIEARHLALLKKDSETRQKLQATIGALEQAELAGLKQQAETVDRKASEMNRLVGIFCVVVGILLMLAFVIILRYIRKTRQYQKALKKAKTRAEDLLKAKEQFVANVSHEVRTPLNAIVGFTQQMQQVETSPQLAEQLKLVRSSSEHLNKIVNDILDFSKLESGKVKFEQIGFEPGKLIEDTMKLFHFRITEKKLDPILEIDPGLPGVLIGDPLRLKQILYNLLGNAIKFTESGTISLVAEQTNKTADRTNLKITVADTGIGISREKLKVIFDDFTQAESNTSRLYGGTGLGLTITKKLVEGQGGKLEIQSEKGQGTRISFQVPYKPGHVYDLPANTKSPFAPPIDLDGKKILIADDEEYNRILLQTILEQWNVKFKVVENGEQAIGEVQKNSYDALLLDIRMPKIDGYQAAKYIRTELKNHKLPIIALTAAAASIDKKKGKSSGINDFLSKPFEIEDLKEKLKKAVGNGFTQPPKQPKPQAKKGTKPTAKKSHQVNLKHLEHLSQNNPGFIGDMLKVFTRTTGDGIAGMKEGLANNDLKQVGAFAHKIAGPCRHLELNVLYSLLKKIEARAETGTGQKEIETLVRETEGTAEEVIKEIKSNYLNKHSNQPK